MGKTARAASSGGGGSTTVTVQPAAPAGVRKARRKAAAPPAAAVSAAAAGVEKADRHQSWRVRAKMAIRRYSHEPSSVLTPRAPLTQFLKQLYSATLDRDGGKTKIRIAHDVVPYVRELLDQYAVQFLRPTADVTRDVRGALTTKAEDVEHGLAVAHRTCGPRWATGVPRAGALAQH